MSRTITVTIDEQGDQVFLNGHGADVFLGLGDTRTQRASHVEPDNWLLRFLFHFIRHRTADDSRLAAFTRRWPCPWRVNTAPIGGPILRLKHVIRRCAWPVEDNVATWRCRQDAIDAEVEFLNQFFFTGEKI